MSDRPAEKSLLRGLSFCGVAMDGNSVVVDVRNNKVIRIRPLHYDWKYDPRQFNSWKIKARDKSFEPSMKTLIPPISLGYKKRVYSPNRILYPLKRVDWDPDGERNPQNRGISKYERISWDEALTLITGEIKRIKQKYGMTAVLFQGDGHGETKVLHSAHGCAGRLLDLLGGFTVQARNADSWEGWYWGSKHVWGMQPVGLMRPMTNLIPDTAENTELLLFWGCDPETNTWGWAGQLTSRLCYWFRELGIKSIYVCPDLNYGAAIHADKWIPVRPNTDAALHLAIAYIWMTEGTYDKNYLATHTTGFDKFEQYVLGKEDGIPKTPGWASSITGVPSRIIKAFARTWASKRTSTTHNYGGSLVRGPYSSEPARLEVFLLAMQGVGKPGVNQMRTWGITELGLDDDCATPGGVALPDVTAASQGQRMPDIRALKRGLIASDAIPPFPRPQQSIPKTLIPDAILNAPISWFGSGKARDTLESQFTKFTYPAPGCSEIHMIWTDTPCWITCWNNSNRIIEAYRSPKIEFMMAQHPWMENDCQYADIVLPANTEFEVSDISSDVFSGQFHTVMVEEQCVSPLGESKSDYEIVCAIAEKFGLLKEYTFGRSQEDWKNLGLESSGVSHLIKTEELKKKGYFVVPTDPKWKAAKPGLQGFYENPEKHPLQTPSGKIEFFSEQLARNFPDDKERPPVPHWIERGPTHDERLSGERALKYPLLIISNHGRWRVHAQHDDMNWLREIFTCKVKGSDGYLYEPVWIHPADAAKRGIKDGDIVKVFNERGGVLGGARVWERIMPGVVYMDHGARHDPIIVGELDRGGAINTITPAKTTSKNTVGMATSGFLVEVEQADIEELQKKYPEAFSRPYDSASGLKFERVLRTRDT
jgi:molybdopterin guanine dinucleotide-containing S/N-oxide reductase-like protein